MSLEITWVAIDENDRVMVGTGPLSAPRPAGARILDHEPELEQQLFDILALTAPDDQQPALYFGYDGRAYRAQHGLGTLLASDLPVRLCATELPSPPVSTDAPRVWHDCALARTAASDIVCMLYVCARSQEPGKALHPALPALPALHSFEPVDLAPLVRFCAAHPTFRPLVQGQRMAGTRLGGLVKQWQTRDSRWVVPPERLVARLAHLYRTLGPERWLDFCGALEALYAHFEVVPRPQLRDWLASWPHVLPWSGLILTPQPRATLRLTPPMPTEAPAAYRWGAAR